MFTLLEGFASNGKRLWECILRSVLAVCPSCSRFLHSSMCTIRTRTPSLHMSKDSAKCEQQRQQLASTKTATRKQLNMYCNLIKLIEPNRVIHIIGRNFMVSNHWLFNGFLRLAWDTIPLTDIIRTWTLDGTASSILFVFNVRQLKCGVNSKHHRIHKVFYRLCFLILSIRFAAVNWFLLLSSAAVYRNGQSPARGKP